MKPKFISQAKDNGHDPKKLEKIWTDWEAFLRAMPLTNHILLVTLG